MTLARLLRILLNEHIIMHQAITTRRGFLTGRTSGAESRHYPPGVTAASATYCSRCGECVDTCPTKIISIAAGVPTLDFWQGECTFCGACAARCPERVFPPEATLAFPHRAAIGESCLAVNFVDCQACRDVCAPMAIRFTPQVGGPFLPLLDAAACNGCGACIAVCPAGAVAMVPVETEASHA
jgi:ferredoxin-type protein NapF